MTTKTESTTKRIACEITINQGVRKIELDISNSITADEIEQVIEMLQEEGQRRECECDPDRAQK